MAKTHRKRPYKAKRVKPSFLRKMRDYRILPILTVALFLYLQYSACFDYGPPMKCNKRDLCRYQGFDCSFKHKDDFEGVCVKRWEVYGHGGKPWPDALIEKWLKGRAETAERLKREEAAMKADHSPIPDTKFDSDPKVTDTPFQPDPQLSVGPQPEFKLSDTPITSNPKHPGTTTDSEPEKLETTTVLEPPSKTDDETDHLLIPDTKFDSDSKCADTLFQPEWSQFSGGFQPDFKHSKTPITSESKLPGIAIDPESEKPEITTVLEPPSKTDNAQEKTSVADTEKPLGPDLGRQMEQLTFGGHVEAHKKGNGWKKIEVPMTPAMKAKMDRYQQVKKQQQKVLKTLFEHMEEIFYEQIGTTAEERETAAKAKRKRELRLWKMHREKNSDVKTTDETTSSHTIPEKVVEKAENIQQDSESFETELGYDMQYGLYGNGNTVAVNGHGFAEGPAISDGNATTKFTPREDVTPSLDEPWFDPSTGKRDPVSMEGMPDNPVIVAGSYNGVSFQKNTSLTRVRVIAHKVLCSPVTGPLDLISAVVTIAIRIVIAIL